MQHHDSLIYQGAIENSRDTLFPFNTKLEQAVTHGARVWQAEIGAELQHHVSEAQIASEQSSRKV